MIKNNKIFFRTYDAFQSALQNNQISGDSIVFIENRGLVWTHGAFFGDVTDDLVNYCLKSETYTKAEVQALIDTVEKFTYRIVPELPTASADTMYIIYLVPSNVSTALNIKDEYITIDNGEEAETQYTWEQIGSTAVNMSGYYTSQQTDSAITAALNTTLAAYTTTADLTTLLAAKQGVIDAQHKLSADLIDDTNSTNKFTNATEKQTWNNKQKAIAEGRGITITTGADADTVSFNLPIYEGSGTNSIAEGLRTIASGNYSHAEGLDTTASGYNSHAEGYGTTARGESSHAEGYGTTTSGIQSHAEGYYTEARGESSHAEGQETTANGNYSHAEGIDTIALGNYSHAEGRDTIASNRSEHASGQYNVSSKATTTFGDSGNTLFSVGNGTSNLAKHNAFEIRQNGDIYITNGGQDVKLQDTLGNKVDKTTTVNGHALSGNVTVTASDVGLGNVGNFKAVSTEANQNLIDVEKSNAQLNMGLPLIINVEEDGFYLIDEDGYIGAQLTEDGFDAIGLENVGLGRTITITNY